jgi:hypothetical protein
MEQADWTYQGFGAAQARFLMVTAITHHRFSPPIWTVDPGRTAGLCPQGPPAANRKAIP